jgi:hypothetical protein
MRSTTKAIIGFGSIWGLFALGRCLWGSFTIGINDTAPEIVAIILYGMTILPACVLAIWFQRKAAFWLVALFPIALYGCIYQIVKHPTPGEGYISLTRDILILLGICAIPAVLGVLLLRSGNDDSQTESEK